jgi:hypothetical protein
MSAALMTVLRAVMTGSVQAACAARNVVPKLMQSRY